MTTYHLSIHKSCDSYSGMKTFSSKELQLDNEQDFLQAQQLCENRKNMAGFWKQTVLPIRTDRASDLFFPTLMNAVIKAKNLSKNFFVVLAAIIWDLATLPIRLVTFLPRMVCNAMATPEEHPLIAYLKGKGLEAVNVEGESPSQVSLNGNGVRETRTLEKNGRANVLLYTKQITDGGRVEEQSGRRYVMYLTDREIAFPTTYDANSGFFSRNSLDGNPLPELAKWADSANS